MMVFLSLPENHPTHNGLVQRGPITTMPNLLLRHFQKKIEMAANGIIANIRLVPDTGTNG
jgi:hypothetical protein